MKSATLALVVLATSLSSWSVIHLPANAVPSSKHYRESGVGNATGRSGSAHMTARALVDKNGHAVVEVTTGKLDSTSTPPGSFRKVQYKALNSAGDPVLVQNFFPSTARGYYSFSAPFVHRAQQLQLQANINGVDGNRTDVVTVIETVKARPDLMVAKLGFPSSAFVNQAVNISANLVEMNGDAGATTNCVLAIDGNAVDHAKNVYVDAGGSVSCAFVYTFDAIGGHTIEISAANMAPADWDTSNNSASGTIEITTPNNAEHSTASFQDNNGGFPVISTNSYKLWHFGTLVEDLSTTSGISGQTQNSDVMLSSSGCAGTTKATAWQFPVKVTYTESMDGTLVYSFTDTGITGTNVTYAGGFSNCGTVATQNVQAASDFVNDHWNTLNSSQSYDSAGNLIESSQSIESARLAGDVTYISYNYQCWYLNSSSGTCNDPGDYYVVNGTIVAVGSTWVPSIVAQDASGNTFAGSVSVPLSTMQQTNVQPNTCFSDADGSGYSEQGCSSFNYNYTLTEGSVN